MTIQSSKESNIFNREYDIILIASESQCCCDLSHLEMLPLKIAIYSETKMITMLPTIESSKIQKIEDLTGRTKILMNLKTENINYIKDILDSCISTKTDYIDNCSDVGILKPIFLLYDGKAHSSGIKIIQGCILETLLIDIGVRILEEIYEARNAELIITLAERKSSFNNEFSKYHFTEFVVNQSEYLLKRRKVKTARFQISIKSQQLKNIFEKLTDLFMNTLWMHLKIDSNASEDGKIILESKLCKKNESVRMVINVIENSFIFCMAEVAMAVFEMNNTSDNGVLTVAVATRKSKIIDRLISKNVKFNCHKIK